jgi:hypothetical protein
VAAIGFAVLNAAIEFIEAFIQATADLASVNWQFGKRALRGLFLFR